MSPHHSRAPLFLVALLILPLAGCTGGTGDDSALRAEVQSLTEKVKALEARLDGQAKELVTERLTVRDPRVDGAVTIGTISAKKDNQDQAESLAPASANSKQPLLGILLSEVKPRSIGLIKSSRIELVDDEGNGTFTCTGADFYLADYRAHASIGVSDFEGKEPFASVGVSIDAQRTEGTTTGVNAASMTAWGLGGRVEASDKSGHNAAMDTGETQSYVQVGRRFATKTENGKTRAPRGPLVRLMSSADPADAGSHVLLSRSGDLAEDSARIRLTVLDSGPNTVTVRDAVGRGSVNLGVSELEDTKTGAMTTTAPGLTVFGLDGKVLDRLPR